MPLDTELNPNIRAALYLILAGVCAALHVWKLPPALPALQTEFGLDLVESGFLLSIVQLGGMLLGLLIGLIAERFGLRRCVMSGLALLAAASVAGAHFNTAATVMLFRSIEGCGFLMVVMPVPSLIRRIVPPANLSRIMGLWSCYMPLGTGTILIAGAWLLRLGDWRMLWTVLAALTLFILLLIWSTVPADSHVRPDRAGPRKDAVARSSALHMIRLTLSSPDVWKIALIFGLYSAQWMAVIGFLPAIYAAAGLSGTTAGFLTAIVAAGNIVGNLLAGQLLHRGVPASRLLVTGFICMIIGAFTAFGANLPVTAQFGAVLGFSAAGGLIPATLFVLAVSVAPTPQTTTTTVGWMQQGSSLGQFSGPPVVAWVVSVAGGWQWTWLATAAYAMIGIGLALTIRHNARTRT